MANRSEVFPYQLSRYRCPEQQAIEEEQMDQEKGLGQAGRKLIRKLCKGAVALSAAWLLAVAATSVVKLSEPLDPKAAAKPDWGSEVLAAVSEQAFEISPLAIANACGIGASSCFKCHNGTRAVAPKMDKKMNPWHTDHKTVNDSCVGCHGGNARIIKKEIAHTNLTKDPRGKGDLCANCHKSGDSTALLKTYQAAASGGK
jgi:hypothetical protein